MIIYPSEKVLPYVYKCVNKVSGKIYIGYRFANTQPSHIDFPNYKTSSSLVKQNFHDFEWQIIAEFFDPLDAYWCEQFMIMELWGNPLLLNRHYVDPINNTKAFRNNGSPDISYKISKSLTGRKQSSESNIKRSLSLKGRPGKPQSEETKNKIREKRKNQVITKQSIEKSSKSRLGKKRGPYKKPSEEVALQRSLEKSKRQLGKKHKTHSNKGKPSNQIVTDETKLLLSEKAKNRKQQRDEFGRFISTGKRI